jgi:hypothetical protein
VLSEFDPTWLKSGAGHGILRSEFFISVYLKAFFVFTPVKCIICNPLDDSQWTEVRLAGLEFASTLLRQPWRSYMKRQCHEIFCSRFFFMKHLPQAPGNNASEGALPVSTSSAVNLPPIFRKKSKRYTQGLGFMMIYEKYLKSKISWNYPFKAHLILLHQTLIVPRAVCRILKRSGSKKKK